MKRFNKLYKMRLHNNLKNNQKLRIKFKKNKNSNLLKKKNFQKFNNKTFLNKCSDQAVFKTISINKRN
jgi:predicted lactoylglutathione lyase